MNKIQKLFKEEVNILSVYFTAGYPNLHDTTETILTLQDTGVKLIEVGMPYSDPMADGETIQKSSALAIQNGMTLDILFDQLEAIIDQVTVPLVFMGYLNQWMQYGIEKFCVRAKKVGISGLIIPDLPLDIYQEEFKEIIKTNGLTISFLITPNTSNQRIALAARLSSAFLYVVSQSSITGSSKEFSTEQIAYFQRIKELKISTPTVLGFGISDASSYHQACQYANGAIIGSAFIRALKKDNLNKSIRDFIGGILK
ncbi:MAG: tryptophan synthase subunit alpha [Saprospiraceae bacterium]